MAKPGWAAVAVDGRLLVAKCRNTFWQALNVRPGGVEPLVHRTSSWAARAGSSQWTTGSVQAKDIPFGSTRSGQLGSILAFTMLSKRICEGDRGGCAGDMERSRASRACRSISVNMYTCRMTDVSLVARGVWADAVGLTNSCSSHCSSDGRRGAVMAASYGDARQAADKRVD